MPPKGGNAKKESGRAKKAENEAKKQAVAEADKVRPNPNRFNADLTVQNTGAQGSI